MELHSSCEQSSYFFMRNRRMFLDSCILNEMSEDQSVSDLVKEAGELYSTYIAAISLLEVGFGPRTKASSNQQELAINLYTSRDFIKVSGSSIDTKDPIGSDKSRKKYLYIPEEHEWYGARHNLIEWMENEGAGGSSARKQANDALIFLCAWNANSFLVTDNTKDFNRFNRIMYKSSGGHLPIFTLEDLRRSKNERVVFPENVPNYP